MQKITADSLIEQLAIISEDIMAEAVKQPNLFIQFARYRVDKMRERAQVTAELEATRARIAVKIRNTKTGEGDKKMTEGALKEHLETHPKVIRLREGSDRAYEEEELSKLMLEACRQRNSAIKIVAEMQTYEGQREGVELEREEQSRKMRNTARRLTDKRRSISSGE